MSESGTVWSITINHPNDDDRNALKSFPNFVKQVLGQDEVGEGGTLHFQGLVRCKYTVKFKALKQWLPRAHIEKARNVQALTNYVKKEETAVEGTRIDQMSESVSQSKEFVTPSKFPRLVVKHFLQWMDEVEWCLDGKNYLLFDYFDYGLVRDVAIDATIRHMIRQGWHIEIHAVNPSLMKALKTFWVELLDEAQGGEVSPRSLSFVQHLKKISKSKV